MYHRGMFIHDGDRLRNEFRVWAELRPDLDDGDLPDWLRAYAGWEGWWRLVRFRGADWYQPVTEGWNRQHFVPPHRLWLCRGRDYGHGPLGESCALCEDPVLIDVRPSRA